PSTALTPLSLHDALPILSVFSFHEGWGGPREERGRPTGGGWSAGLDCVQEVVRVGDPGGPRGVEDHLCPSLLGEPDVASGVLGGDRKSTRLNSSHVKISY